MKFLFPSIFALALAVVPAGAAVDPALLALMPPDATAIAGVNLEQSQATPFGQFLISRLPPDGGRDRLMAATGFDPVRDLKEIVLAGTAPNKGIIVGRGVFDPARISAAAKLAGAPVTTYKGVDMIGAKNSNSGLAFLDASTVAIGDAAALIGIIDRRATAGSLSSNLAQKARTVATANDAWLVALAPSALVNGKLADPNQPQTRLLQAVQEFSAGVKFGQSVISFNAEALTASTQDAQALADVLRFLVAMIPPKNQEATALLSSARFTTEGSVTRISLDIPEDQAEELIKTGTRTRVMPRRIQR